MYLRILLIVLLIYNVLRFFQRILRPVQPNRQAGNYYSQQKAGRKEGEVTVTKGSQDKQKKVDRDEGDYIDYEEV